MKKLIALILAIVMMASMSVVAFAAATTEKLADEEGDIDSDQKNIPVKYTVTKGYYIEIPASFDLMEPDGYVSPDGSSTYGVGSGIVKIVRARLNGGETLTVTVDSANEPDGLTNYSGAAITTKWVLKDSSTNNSKPVGYTIALTGAEENANFGQGETVVDLVSGEAVGSDGKMTTMTVTTQTTTQAGEYQDQLTFKASIE